jgi:hypothetical protein
LLLKQAISVANSVTPFVSFFFALHDVELCGGGYAKAASFDCVENHNHSR